MISNPDELNNYEPFTAGVYGGTSFELVNDMIDMVLPIANEMKFIDLGSGVGQVVLQVFKETHPHSPLKLVSAKCQVCVGIEKGKIPSEKAIAMDSLFRKWMAW